MEQQEERPWYSCLHLSSPSPLYHHQQQYTRADPLDPLVAAENHSSPHHQLLSMEQSHEYQCSPLPYSNHQCPVQDNADHHECLQVDYSSNQCPPLEHGDYQCSPMEPPNLQCSSVEGSSFQCSPVQHSPLERSNLTCSTLESFGLQSSPLEQPVIQSSTLEHSNMEQNDLEHNPLLQALSSNQSMSLQYLAPSSLESSTLEATPGVVPIPVETSYLEPIPLEAPLMGSLETPRLLPLEAPGLDLIENGGVDGLGVVTSGATGIVETMPLENWNTGPLDHWNSPTTTQQHPMGLEESSPQFQYQGSISVPVPVSHFHHPTAAAAAGVLEPTTLYDPTAGSFIHTFSVKVEEQDGDDDDDDKGGVRMERYGSGGRCNEMQRGNGEIDGMGGVNNMCTVRMGSWPEEHNNNNNRYVSEGSIWVWDSTSFPTSTTTTTTTMAAASTPPRSPTTHLHPINDSQGGMSTSVGKRIDSKVCGVCGDKALGYNFNAITCESCKAFFRRNALKKKEFRCPFNESCKVDQITRRFCQKCRLRKCFEIGMKKEWIMTDEEKQRKKQKIEENRARKFTDDDSTSCTSTNISNMNIIQPHINDNNTNSTTNNTQPRSSHVIINRSPTPPSTLPSHSLPPLPPTHRYVDDDSISSLSSTTSPVPRSRQFSPVGQFCPFSTSVVGVEPTKPQAVVVGVIRSEEDIAGIKVARLEGQSDVSQARHSSPAIPSPTPKSHGTPEDKDHLMLLGEEGGGGLASSSPLGSMEGGGGGGASSSTGGAERAVDQGGPSSPRVPPTTLDIVIKEEVEFPEDSPCSPIQTTTHSWQEAQHRLEASQVVREALPWSAEASHQRENATSQSVEEFQKQLEAGDGQESHREQAAIVQHHGTLDTSQEHLLALRSPPDTCQDHLRRPPDTPHSLDTNPLDTQHLRQPPGTPHSLDTPPLDTHHLRQPPGTPHSLDTPPLDTHHHRQPPGTPHSLDTPPLDTHHHLRQPPGTPHSLDTPPLDTHHHRQPPDTPHSLDTSPLDTQEQQQEYLETSCGHMEAGEGGREHQEGRDDNMGSGFSIREALSVLQPGCKDDPSSSLSISSIMDTAITAEYSSFTLLAGADPGALNQAEQVKLAELSEANKGLMAPLSEDYNFKDLNDPSLINVINLTEIAIRRLIKMAKRITAFKSLCQEDQIALLKGGCTEMMILRSLCAYDPDKDSWKIQEDHESFKSIQLKVLKSAPGNVYEEHKRFIDSFLPEWRRDPNIIFLLSAITLFSPQRPNIVHSPAILHEQCSYLYLLKRYLEGCYGWCEGRTVYHSLLQRLTHLHLLSENHIRVFLEVNPRQVEPLLIEIFDLKQR